MAPDIDAWRFTVGFDPDFLVCVFVWFGDFFPLVPVETFKVLIIFRD